MQTHTGITPAITHTHVQTHTGITPAITHTLTRANTQVLHLPLHTLTRANTHTGITPAITSTHRYYICHYTHTHTHTHTKVFVFSQSVTVFPWAKGRHLSSSWLDSTMVVNLNSFFFSKFSFALLLFSCFLHSASLRFLMTSLSSPLLKTSSFSCRISRARFLFVSTDRVW
ncbi:hypothetical protein AGOR_G00057580 [Albula goreensis]|uniref:Uncharacterized protein n=1 Tax=Albula goreensis TaxID=1534307 RepID=A0A8T3E3J4_9TELE|nr:hypothetical protein AGOR_G00057580 [Albula goreensis]